MNVNVFLFHQNYQNITHHVMLWQASKILCTWTKSEYLSNIIKHYLDKPNNKVSQETTTFFITHWKPFKTAPEITISRWVKEVMTKASTKVRKDNTHSGRSASATGALYKGVHIEGILRQGEWKNLKLFKNNHFKSIESLSKPKDFGRKHQQVLNRHLKSSKTCEGNSVT